MPDELDQIIVRVKSTQRRKLLAPRGKASQENPYYMGTDKEVDTRATKARKLLEFNVQRPLRKIKAGDVRKMQQLREALSESWPLVEDAIQEMSFLTTKQIAFAKAYAANGRSNKSEAVRLAGYEQEDERRWYYIARNNLEKPGMEKLIVAFEHEQKRRLKMTVDDVVKYFSKIADTAMEAADFTNANRAMENLAKYLQMFVTKTEITHRTVSTAAELDARIAEYSAILEDNRPEIEQRLRLN